MQIKKIELTNFQSHEKTILELSPLVNVITGPTDSGKSAIWRALKKLFRDTPSGNFFVRKGQKGYVVSALLDNGNTIKRIVEVSKERTTKNAYKVNGDEFVGFGKAIPLEVNKASGMSSDFSDLSLDLNFQDQYETPLLLKDPPSFRAKVLGKIIGTDVLDRASQEVRSEKRKSSTLLDSLGKEIQEIRTSLSQFADLDDLEKQLNYVKEKALLLEGIKETKLQLENLNTRFNACCLALEKAKRIDLKEILVIEKELEDIEKEEKIYSLEQSLLEKSNELNGLKGKLEVLKDVNKIEEKISFLFNLNIEKEKLESINKTYWETSNNLFGAQDRLAEMSENFFDESNKFVQYLKKLGKCPTCYNPLTTEKIAELVKI